MVRNLDTISSNKYYLPFAAVALIAGTFFRFWDLAGAPLAVDEYYFGTSILNIAERGLPEFACGGFYTRGILIQYLSVPLLFLGGSLEFAARFWPAVTSLLSIAAVWRIARLAGGVKTAVIATILTSLSVWEIEFARFGRMYAPFQAVFLWYVYFQILHLLRGHNAARWVYLALSAVSIFIYAGASFLLAFNFLALIWPGKRWSPGHLVVATILLVGGVAFFTTDFRHLDVAADSLPASAHADAALSLPINIPVLPDLILPFIGFGLFFLGLLLWRDRSAIRVSHLSAIYWAFAAVSACFGLLGLAFGLTIAALLLRLPSPLAKTPTFTIFVLVAVWPAALTALFWLDGDGLLGSVKKAVSYVFNYPDVYHLVVRPWLQAIPVTTTMLGFLAALQLRMLLAKPHSPSSDELTVQRYVAASLILLFMLAALFYQPYTITRYTYFLYPLLLVFAAISIVSWSAFLFERTPLLRAGMFVPVLLLFTFTEDFDVGHLVDINEPRIRYRSAYDEELAGHYYFRWDFRGAASFVNERQAPNDTIITFSEPLPHYLRRTSGIYIEPDSRKESNVWACDGTKDLWSNAPLLDDEAVLRLITQASGNVWLIARTAAYRSRHPLEASLPEQYHVEPEFVSQDGHLAVYRLPPGDRAIPGPAQ
jgi:hypothetical protein